MQTNLDELEKTIASLLTTKKLALVDINLGRHRGEINVHLVLHKSGGITLSDLTEAQKILRPCLEMELNREDLALEISSPGTSRVIKHQREYQIFIGEKVKLLVEDEWMEGIIHSAGNQSIELILENDHTRTIPFADIRKGKLGL